MAKSFDEALTDGFKKVTTITDPEALARMRSEGILVDLEGFYVFQFGEKKEFSLCLEPIGEGFLVSLYKHKVRITEPLPMKPLE